MEPAGGSTGENRPHRKTPSGGRKDDVGVIGYGAQRVKAATEAAPARTEKVILGQPVPPGFLEIEGTAGESCWNNWASRHGSESCRRRSRNETQPVNARGCLRKRQSAAPNADWLHSRGPGRRKAARGGSRARADTVIRLNLNAISTIGVVGLGTIGSQELALWQRSGHQTVGYDISDAQVKAARDATKSNSGPAPRLSTRITDLNDAVDRRKASPA